MTGLIQRHHKCFRRFPDIVALGAHPEMTVKNLLQQISVDELFMTATRWTRHMRLCGDSIDSLLPRQYYTASEVQIALFKWQ